MTENPQALTVPHQDLTTDDEFEYAFLANGFERNVARIVSDLRALANQIEQVKAPAADQASPGFAAEAAMVVSRVMNALPNLGLDALIHAAEQADTTLLAHRLGRAVSENEVLRANPGLPVAPLDDAEPGPNGIGVGSIVIDVNASDDPESGDFGEVTALQEDGYSVRWHGDFTAKYAAAEEVMLATDVPETFTRI